MAVKKKGMSDVSIQLSPLKDIQARRLSNLAGVNKDEISGLNIAEISDKFKVEFDRTILFYRTICGQVVKTNPDTGVQHPVPYATVHVEDTDCRLLTYAPPGSPYLWFFPLFCEQEEIGSTVTDECGRFCVKVPRWDIDWILKWRKERICLPYIMAKPTIRDVLDDLFPQVREIIPRGPQPDPVPRLLSAGDEALQRARGVLGTTVVDKIEQFYERATFGKSTTEVNNFLNTPAFSKSLPPPLPDDISSGVQLCGKVREYAKLGKEALHTISTSIKSTPELSRALTDFQMDRYIGPFRRCFDIYIPPWSIIFDVPDITFRVTQDIDGDGDEETIYSEGLFDVRWDSGDIPDVTLEASEIAQESELSADTCQVPEDIPCETPAIVMAGLMPLHNPPVDPIPYHDQDTGYAKRPNRPHPSGTFGEDPPLDPDDPQFPQLLATTPFTGSVQLYGCNEHEGAEYYRICYKYNGGDPHKFTGRSWKVFRWVGTPGHLEVKVVSPDADGWYPIIPVSEQWLPSHLLLSWPTPAFQNGLYDVYMELTNSGKTTVIHTTPEIGIRVDNTWRGSSTAGAVAHFSVLRWRHVGEGDDDWRSLLVSCPVIRRNTGEDIEIDVGIEVGAPHLRTIRLRARGCGLVHPVLESDLPPKWESYSHYIFGNGMQHWHTSAFDNGYNNTLAPARYNIPALAPNGVYSFHLAAHSRAFNPAGSDVGFDNDWHYNPVFNWVQPEINIAVVDA